MKFVKQHAFLLILVGAVVVGGAALLAVASIFNGKADAYAARRTDLAGQLQQYNDSTVINQAGVDAARKRVERMKDEAQKVAQCALARNATYDVMKFDIGGKSVAAFPVDKAAYDNAGLDVKFPRLYQQELLDVLKRLGATRPLTDDEVREKVAAAIGTVATPTTPLPTLAAPSAPTAAGADPAAPAPLTQEQLDLNKWIIEKSLAGPVYADETSLYSPMASTSMQYSYDQMWLAQVSLWVQKDLVDALRKTAEDAARIEQKKPGGVPDSPIKRLVRTSVQGYAVRSGGAPMGGAALGGGAMGGAAMSGAPAAGSFGGFGGPPGDIRYLGTGTSSFSSGPRLSQRATNAMHDVVHYSFTAHVSYPYLPLLYRNLMERNYHTILDVQVGPVGRGDAATTVRGGAGAERYYYGTDNVVEVTITGELLLLAELTRGRWDEQAAAWDPKFPPLMPVEFLQQLQQMDPSCLRKVDGERVLNSGVAPPMPMGGVRY